MIKDYIYMGTSIFVRLLTSIVLFMFIARKCGAEDFGLFMYWFTVAAISGLIVDYGFIQNILREVGKNPLKIKSIMSLYIEAKNFLAILLIGTFLFISPVIFNNNDIFILALFLLLATIINSYSEFMIASFRAIGCFHEETKLIIKTNIIQFIIITGSLYIYPKVVIIASSFLISRIITLIISWRAFNHISGGFDEIKFELKVVFETLKKGFPYSADVGLTTLYAQMDTLIINHYIGLSGVGIYQAGLRLFQGATTIAQIISNLFLPKIAYKSDDAIELNKLISNLHFQMLFFGTLTASLFYWGSSWLTEVLYGSDYKYLKVLLPFFGINLLLRYISASYGVILTAVGLQSKRVPSIVIAIITLFIVSICLVPKYGLIGMIIASICSTSILFVIYLYYSYINKVPLGLQRRNVFALVTSFLLLFIYLIKL